MDTQSYKTVSLNKATVDKKWVVIDATDLALGRLASRVALALRGKNNPYLLLTTAFGRWWILAFYIVWFVAIWFHLVHGFWSMLQTVGWNGSVWFKRIKVIGVIVASLIVLMFVATAVNAFVQANFIA